MKKITVSITALADFSCREGNLELTGPIGPSAKEGIRAHQRIQKSRPVDSEVRLEASSSIDEVKVTLRGRVDLLDAQNHSLSEIKTTMVPAHRVTASQQSLHWAQLMLYGYCYWQQLRDAGEPEPQSTMRLELLFVDIRADEETSQFRELTFNELCHFAEDAIKRYVHWQKLLAVWRQKTIDSAAGLDFPHPEFRAGQRDMAAAIFRTVRDSGSLLCEAPTGIGKTISSLFPALKSIAEGEIKSAVYLTAKTSGRASAMQTLRLMENKGLSTTAVLIRSKKPTCFCTNGRCERDEKGVCPMTIGFFDRLPAAREEAMMLGIVDGDQLDEIAWEHQLCPFELALQLLPWVSLAVCDFNYVFDPLVRLGRFSESRRDTALLIDEVHNLVDRARDMHSGHIRRSEILQNAHELKNTHPLLAAECDKLSQMLLRLAKGQSEDIVVEDKPPATLAKAAGALAQSIMNASEQGPPLGENSFELFKRVCRYAVIHELYSDDHRLVITVDKKQKVKEVIVQLKCVNATAYLKPQYRLFRSAIAFSATLRPAVFFRDTLGLPEETRQLVLRSPFDPHRVQHSLVTYINTRFKNRDSSCAQIVELLKNLLDKKRGNYMVFFPSYAYMRNVHAAFLREKVDVDVWCQPQHSSVEEREALLECLASPGHRIGFAILGGVFGEGVDYVGDLLVGIVLVGIGLPGTGVEQDLIAESYESKGLVGYDYAYRYPGFTRVLQTAGRLIRSENDAGVIVMVDDRFAQPFYKDLFPEHWQVDLAISPSHLQSQLTQFWRKPEMS